MTSIPSIYKKVLGIGSSFVISFPILSAFLYISLYISTSRHVCIVDFVYDARRLYFRSRVIVLSSLFSATACLVEPSHRCSSDRGESSREPNDIVLYSKAEAKDHGAPILNSRGLGPLLSNGNKVIRLPARISYPTGNARVHRQAAFVPNKAAVDPTYHAEQRHLESIREEWSKLYREDPKKLAISTKLKDISPGWLLKLQTSLIIDYSLDIRQPMVLSRCLKDCWILWVKKSMPKSDEKLSKAEKDVEKVLTAFNKFTRGLWNNRNRMNFLTSPRYLSNQSWHLVIIQCYYHTSQSDHIRHITIDAIYGDGSRRRLHVYEGGMMGYKSTHRNIKAKDMQEVDCDKE